MHILLVRFSSMGDVVLQTATVNWLKSLLGSDLRLTFLTSSEFVELLEGHQEIHRVIGFHRRKGEKWENLVHRLKDLHKNDPIDLIVDLHGTLRSLRLKVSLWTIPALTVDKRRWERFLLTKVRNKFLRKIFEHPFFGLGPQVERIIEDFENIFSDSFGKKRTQSFREGPHDELTSLDPFLTTEISRPYVVLAPSASFVPKRWPVLSFVELSKKLLHETTYDVVVLAGKDDTFCEAFNEVSSDRLHQLQGKTTLKESMAFLSKAKLCIGNDSGMNHIAEAYGVPSLTLFGPTDPRFGFRPHGTKSRILEKELSCRPCSTTGKKPCHRERHFCMEEITVEEVFKNVKEMLDQI